jgi:LPS sulfotransferase NodH
VAGQPTEFFSPTFEKYWKAQWETLDYASYLERVVAAGTSPNGVFGAKTHPRQFARFLQQVTGRASVDLEDQPGVVEEWFPGMRYVWLRRRNSLRQAVSFTRSWQTQVWWNAEEAPAPYCEPQPETDRFDYSQIEATINMLEEDDGEWRRFFNVNGIEPLVLDYEEIAGDHAGAANLVLGRIGAELPPGFHFPATQFRRQADVTTERWVERYSRLVAAKRERILSAFAGIHEGETIAVIAGEVPADWSADLGDLITLALHPAGLETKVDYALVTGVQGALDEAPALPDASVVFTTVPFTEVHPFVVPLRTQKSVPPDLGGRNDLGVPDRPCHPVYLAIVLAARLGAHHIVVTGIDQWRPVVGSTSPEELLTESEAQLRTLGIHLAARGVTVSALDADHRARPLFPAPADLLEQVG